MVRERVYISMKPSKDRIYYFDNAKAFLIWTVVLGHLLGPVPGHYYVIEFMVKYIYLFHMPAFIFISGYFVSTNTEKGWFVKLMKRFTLPYIIIQLIFIAYTQAIGIEQYQYTLLQPAYVYWYLFAMIFWTLGIKGIAKSKIRLEIWVLIFMIAGVLVGYIECISWELSLSRIIVFYPYFILGYSFRKNKRVPNQVILNNKVAVVILLGIGVVLFILCDSIDLRMLYCSVPYSKIGLEGSFAGISRMFLYGISFVMIFSVFALIPTGKIRITPVGQTTYSIYIIHAFLVKLLGAWEFYKVITVEKIVGLFLASFFIVLICYKGVIVWRRLLIR